MIILDKVQFCVLFTMVILFGYFFLNFRIILKKTYEEKMVKYLSEKLHWFSLLHEPLKLIPHVHKPFCWYSCWLLYASTGKY